MASATNMRWKFKEHGIFYAKKAENIFVIEGEGPWNIEMLHNAGVSAQPIVNEFTQNYWGVLVVMHGETVYLPDAAKRLVQIIKQQKGLKRVATAIIVVDSCVPKFA